MCEGGGGGAGRKHYNTASKGKPNEFIIWKFTFDNLIMAQYLEDIEAQSLLRLIQLIRPKTEAQFRKHIFGNWALPY